MGAALIRRSGSANRFTKSAAHGFERALSGKPQFECDDALIEQEGETVGGPRTYLARFAEKLGWRGIVDRIVDEVVWL